MINKKEVPEHWFKQRRMLLKGYRELLGVMGLVLLLWRHGYKRNLTKMLKVFEMTDFQNIGDQDQTSRTWKSWNFLVVTEKLVQH